MKTYFVTIFKIARDVSAKEKEALTVHAESDIRAAGLGPIDLVAFESSMPIETVHKTLEESGMKFSITESTLVNLPKDMMSYLLHNSPAAEKESNEKLTLEEQIKEAAGNDDSLEVAAKLLKHSKEQGTKKK